MYDSDSEAIENCNLCYNENDLKPFEELQVDYQSLLIQGRTENLQKL